MHTTEKHIYRKGLCFLELLIVLTLLSSIACIALPSLYSRSKKAKIAIFEQNIKEAVENARYKSIINGQISSVIVSGEKIIVQGIDSLYFEGIIAKRIWINAQGDLYEE